MQSYIFLFSELAGCGHLLEDEEFECEKMSQSFREVPLLPPHNRFESCIKLSISRHDQE